MILSESNFIGKIYSFSREEWKPLIDLIPKIENLEKFGDNSKAMKLLEEDISLSPQYIEHRVVEEFREIVYSMPIMIDFNWASWDDGRKIVGDENFDYCSIDIPTKCKIISAIIRNDRFCDGALVSAFESGLILKILK